MEEKEEKMKEAPEEEPAAPAPEEVIVEEPKEEEPAAEAPEEAPSQEEEKEEPVAEEKVEAEKPEAVEEKTEEEPAEKEEPEPAEEPVVEKEERKPAAKKAKGKAKKEEAPKEEEKEETPLEEEEEAPVEEEKKAKPKAPKKTKKDKKSSIESPPLFGKYDLTEINVTDKGLERYINLNLITIPHVSGRHANKPFAKARVSIVERLINGMMRTERYTGKKSKTYKVVEYSFEIINKRTKQNPWRLQPVIAPHGSRGIL